MRLEAGHVFSGPDGQGYKLTRAIQTGDPIMADQFEAFGGAPEPGREKQMPKWLVDEIRKLGMSPW